MSEPMELSAEEQRSWGVFSQLLQYKPLSIRLGQELERERQRNIDLQSEMRRVMQNCDKRIQEVERACRERMEVADKRIAVLEDDFDEAIRELTEITTRAHILKDGADEIIAAAAASRHAPKTPRSATSTDIQRGMERELSGFNPITTDSARSGKVPVPPVAEMRPRENMLKRFIYQHEDDKIPESLLRGPMKPEEREPVNEKDLLARLSSILSPTTAPAQTEERQEEPQR